MTAKKEAIDPDAGLQLKPFVARRLRKSLATPKDKLLTSEQMDAKLRQKSLAERLAEVRRRVIVDFFTGTSPEALHFAACRLCDWTWWYGTTELHEPGCPMREDA